MGKNNQFEMSHLLTNATAASLKVHCQHPQEPRTTEFKEPIVRAIRGIVASLVCLISASVFAQTAEELVARNLQAKGGIEKMKAIQSIRMTGQFENGGFKATIGQESKRPEMLRETFTVQGMTQIQAYDGSS